MTLSASDINTRSWIDRVAPRAVRPYARLMRLDRPIGTYLVLFPCWWGMALAGAPGALGIWPTLGFALLFAIGAVVMRGAGCTINDILDADYDGRVARTATRPIPSGDISRRQAALFLVAQLLVGLVILLQFNLPTIWLGVASLLLVFPYPLMKRITWWPQAWLGLTFNWGALMGFVAVTGRLDGIGPALLLYAGGIAWTLGYDTIYAHQDKEDDVLAGVKSSALWLGEASIPFVRAAYAVALALFGVAGWAAGLGPLLIPGLLLAGLYIAWLLRDWNPDDARQCLALFRANARFALLVLIALLLGLV